MIDDLRRLLDICKSKNDATVEEILTALAIAREREPICESDVYEIVGKVLEHPSQLVQESIHRSYDGQSILNSLCLSSTGSDDGLGNSSE